jgi:hypothetical protein
MKSITVITALTTVALAQSSVRSVFAHKLVSNMLYRHPQIPSSLRGLVQDARHSSPRWTVTQVSHRAHPPSSQQPLNLPLVPTPRPRLPLRRLPPYSTACARRLPAPAPLKLSVAN